MLTDDHPSLARAVPWASGLDQLLDRLGHLLAEHPRVVIAVTGGVGSGKTTLARALADSLATETESSSNSGPSARYLDRGRLGSVMLSTDHYLPDYTADLPVHERDLPEHADLDLLGSQLRDLLAGHPIQRPIWSFLTHKREGSEQLIAPDRGLIVVEGIHAMVETVTEVAHDTAFVHTPVAIRRERFIARDRDGERGMGVEESTRFFDQVADPTFLALATAYLGRARLIVCGDSMD